MRTPPWAPRLFALAAAALALGGCSSGRGGPADAGGDGDAAGDGGLDVPEPAEPAEPAEVAPPSIPCRAGWRAVEGLASVPTCEPWPESGPGGCPAGQAHLPGGEGCERLGPACPAASGWAADLPTDREVVYVRAGAPAGGDGSSASPFATVAEAVEAAPDGAVVALATGTHREMVRLGRGLTLWGACAAESEVACPGADTSRGTLSSVEGSWEARSLRLSGPCPAVSADGGEVRLEDVTVVDAGFVAFRFMGGASSTLRRVAVSGVEADGDDTYGWGLIVETGSNAELSQVTIGEVHDVGVFVGDGSTLRVSDVAVGPVLSEVASGDFGRGVYVVDGGRLEGEGLVVERCREAGLIVSGEGSTAELEDLLVRGTAAQEASRDLGMGLWVELGGALRASRATLSANTTTGVVVIGPVSSASLTDAVVEGTRVQPLDSGNGAGLEANSGGRLELERVLVEACSMAGLSFWDAGTEAVLTDVAVRGTLPDLAPPELGVGLSVNPGPHVTGTRVLFEGSTGAGLHLVGEGTDVTLFDATVRGTLPLTASRAFGRGVSLAEGARLRLCRAVVEENREIGVAATGPGTELVLEDTVVRQTLPDESEDWHGAGWYGYGLAVDSARATVTRARIEESRICGVVVIRPDAFVSMVDVAVVDTLPAACEGCPEGGVGIGAYGGASVEVRRFLVEDNPLCGVQLAVGEELDGEAFGAGGVMDLHDGLVTGSLAGANVQTEGFDLARLLDNVAYVGNDRNLDATVFPVPPATTAF